MLEVCSRGACKRPALCRLRGIAWGMLALLALTLFPPIAQATIFDDGNDRKILFDLRLKPPRH